MLIIAYIGIAVVLEWRNGGGVLPMAILCTLLAATWRAITSQKDVDGVADEPEHFKADVLVSSDLPESSTPSNPLDLEVPISLPPPPINLNKEHSSFKLNTTVLLAMVLSLVALVLVLGTYIWTRNANYPQVEADQKLVTELAMAKSALERERAAAAATERASAEREAELLVLVERLKVPPPKVSKMLVNPTEFKGSHVVTIVNDSSEARAIILKLAVNRKTAAEALIAPKSSIDIGLQTGGYVLIAVDGHAWQSDLNSFASDMAFYEYESRVWLLERRTDAAILPGWATVTLPVDLSTHKEYTRIK
jgi:hypothetical protein